MEEKPGLADLPCAAGWAALSSPSRGGLPPFSRWQRSAGRGGVRRWWGRAAWRGLCAPAGPRGWAPDRRGEGIRLAARRGGEGRRGTGDGDRQAQRSLAVPAGWAGRSPGQGALPALRGDAGGAVATAALLPEALGAEPAYHPPRIAPGFGAVKERAFRAPPGRPRPEERFACLPQRLGGQSRRGIGRSAGFVGGDQTRRAWARRPAVKADRVGTAACGAPGRAEVRGSAPALQTGGAGHPSLGPCVWVCSSPSALLVWGLSGATREDLLRSLLLFDDVVWLVITL